MADLGAVGISFGGSAFYTSFWVTPITFGIMHAIEGQSSLDSGGSTSGGSTSGGSTSGGSTSGGGGYVPDFGDGELVCLNGEAIVLGT